MELVRRVGLRSVRAVSACNPVTAVWSAKEGRSARPSEEERHQLCPRTPARRFARRHRTVRLFGGAGLAGANAHVKRASRLPASGLRSPRQI
jgi:hypothetical protein